MDNYDLSHIRHTLAHILAIAAIEYDPQVQLAIGPTIDTGFYYDCKFSKPFSSDNLVQLQQRMVELVKQNLTMTHETKTISEALDYYKDKNQPFKIELIKDLEKAGETNVSFYTIGNFTDLCRGGHVENTNEINVDAFCLDRVAGAYWRGDEKNPMLTRIYGLAFATQQELDNHQEMIEEAKKRDHRKLGAELDLFTISELVGAGLPLFTPKGAFLRERLASLSLQVQSKYGFEQVWTPHIARTELYKYSGHYDKYPERFEVTSDETDDVFMLKPMNCPHHAQLFSRKPWSYKDLPVRYMENTTNYRDEKSGELHGLSRVRSLSQDDGHVFCQEDQVENEIKNIVKMVKTLYGALDLDYYARLSFRDSSDKFLGEQETWDRAEAIITQIAKDEALDAVVAKGEAAFYGPKIDFMVKDSLGREWQCATIQLDFVQPERFQLSYTAKDGSEKRPVMIHKALLGSIERFLSIYIEHTAGVFPIWLAPVQVYIASVSENFNTEIKSLKDELYLEGIRAIADNANESVGKKIRVAETQKIPFIIVFGEKEKQSGTLAVREHGNKETKELTAKELIDLIRSHNPQI